MSTFCVLNYRCEYLPTLLAEKSQIQNRSSGWLVPIRVCISF